MALIIPLVGAFLVTLAGCSDSPVGAGGDEVKKQPSTTFEAEGTLVSKTVDGRETWVLNTDDEQTYLPVNLKTETLEEGLRVRVEAKRFVADEPMGRGEIARRLPSERVIDAFSTRLIRIENLEVLGEQPEYDSSQMVWQYPDGNIEYT